MFCAKRPSGRFGRVNLVPFVVLAALNPLAAAEDEPGFRPLLNGRNLDGWVKMGPAGFKAKRGKLLCTGQGDYPTWLRTEEVFENFVLRLEYKLTWYGESGVFLHAPLYGRISHEAFEVQLSDDSRTNGPQAHSSGAIFAAVPPIRHKGFVNEWNTLEITFDWPRLRVVLNDEVVQDLDVERHPELRYRPRFGYIGLQDRGKPVQFRNLRIKRLPGSERKKWKRLLAGDGFAGWHLSPDNTATWTVRGGEVMAENGHGYLISPRQYGDGEFRCYVKTSPLANGGVFFRWKTLEPRDRGIEIQIENIPDSNNPTGSIYDVARARGLDLAPGEWYLTQIFLKGRRGVVRVNGTTVATTDELPVDRRGHIALQMHEDDGVVCFKELMFKPLEPQ